MGYGYFALEFHMNNIQTNSLLDRLTIQISAMYAVLCNLDLIKP